MTLHEVMEVKEHAATIQYRGSAPTRESRVRGGDRCRNFVRSAQWNLRDFLAGGGIVLDKSLTARNLRPTVHINRTWLELTGNCTAGHNGTSVDVVELRNGRTNRGAKQTALDASINYQIKAMS